MDKHNLKTTTFLLLCVISITVLICLGLYLSDNKYNSSGPQPSQGVVNINEDDLTENPVIMLIDGWEFYSNKLLAPEEIASHKTSVEYVYIGQYGGFEGKNSNASPHGSGTYHIKLNLPADEQIYSLALPEIFSSYRIYINNNLTAQMGNPDPNSYEAKTLNKIINFKAGGKTEITIAASDFSHFYSGLTYPPIFGKPDDVNKMISQRFLFRAILSVSALTIGLLSIVVAFLNRRRVSAAIYGLLCLFFVGYISYPITKTYFSDYHPFYALENLSYCAMLLFIVILGQRICNTNKIQTRLGVILSLCLCAACLILHMTLDNTDNSIVLYGYSYLITAFQWLVAGYLTVIAIVTAFRNNEVTKPLLVGIIVFDTTLIMDRLLPLHEPIISGWFPELGSFFLIVMIGLTTGKSVVEQFQKNVILEAKATNMSNLFEMQKNYYPLMQEKIDEAKTARHDLRHHLVAISGFLEKENYRGLKEYLAKYQTTPTENEPINYSKNEVADILSHYYVGIAKQHNIKLTLKLDIQKNENIADDDLSSLLSNLLENAVESCLRVEGERFIKISAKSQAGILAIHMENSSKSVKQGDFGFFSSKEQNRMGLGLESIHKTAQKYDGNTEFKFDENKKVFISQVSLSLMRLE